MGLWDSACPQQTDTSLCVYWQMPVAKGLKRTIGGDLFSIWVELYNQIHSLRLMLVNVGKYGGKKYKIKNGFQTGVATGMAARATRNSFLASSGIAMNASNDRPAPSCSRRSISCVIFLINRKTSITVYISFHFISCHFDYLQHFFTRCGTFTFSPFAYGSFSRTPEPRRGELDRESSG
jgi:hypothetical protein